MRSWPRSEPLSPRRRLALGLVLSGLGALTTASGGCSATCEESLNCGDYGAGGQGGATSSAGVGGQGGVTSMTGGQGGAATTTGQGGLGGASTVGPGGTGGTGGTGGAG